MTSADIELLALRMLFQAVHLLAKSLLFLHLSQFLLKLAPLAGFSQPAL